MKWQNQAQLWMKSVLQPRRPDDGFRISPFCISSQDLWNRTTPRFKEGLASAPIMSVDVETRQPNGEPQIIVVGVVTGLSWAISLPELAQEYGYPGTMRDILPYFLVTVLEDQDIIKVGSGQLCDMKSYWEPEKIVVKGRVDTQSLMRHATERNRVFRADPHPNRTGLGHVCELLFQFNHKVVRKSEAKAAAQQNESIPWWRRHQIYNRPKSVWDLSKEQLDCISNDASLPLARVLRWITTLHPYSSQKDIRMAILLLQEAHASPSNVVSPNELDSCTADLEGMLNPPPRPNDENLAEVVIDWDMEEVDYQLLLQETPPTPSASYESEEIGTEVERHAEKQPPTATQAVSSTKPLGNQRNRPPSTIPLALRDDVWWHRECLACASPNHKYTNCKMLQQGDFCEYKFCAGKRPHTIKGCRTLHSRCNECSCRGHVSASCHLHSQRHFFEVFLQAAKHGRYTKRLYNDAAWGFFPWQDNRLNNRDVPVCAQNIYVPTIKYDEVRANILNAGAHSFKQ